MEYLIYAVVAVIGGLYVSNKWNSSKRQQAEAKLKNKDVELKDEKNVLGREENKKKLEEINADHDSNIVKSLKEKAEAFWKDRLK